MRFPLLILILALLTIVAGYRCDSPKEDTTIDMNEPISSYGFDVNESFFDFDIALADSIRITMEDERGGGYVELGINDRGELDIEYSGDVNKPAMFFFDTYLKRICEEWARNSGCIVEEKLFGICKHDYLLGKDRFWSMSSKNLKSDVLTHRTYICKQCDADVIIGMAISFKESKR